MDTVQMVRLGVGPEHGEEVEAEAHALFAAVDRAAPEGVQYLALRADDDLVLLLHLAGGAANPLPGIAEAARFRGLMAQWSLDGPPAPVDAQVLGDHGFVRGAAR